MNITDELERHAKQVMPNYPNDVCSRAKAKIELLTAALKQARHTLVGLRTPLEADKDARGAAIVQINLVLGEHPAGPFRADDGAGT